MAVKELALITEKKKRKKKESVQAAPTKPIKETISNNKGTTKINRSTISTKPSVQKTPQNRVVTNKERLTSKPTISDIRTVKTRNFKPKSIQTVDLYERGGRYFYKDGKKEKEVDQKFVQNALKNNKSGVIGRYDSKGTLRATDKKGNVKKQSLLDKAGFLGRTAGTRAIKGTTSIVDAALQETQNDLQKGKDIKSPLAKLSQLTKAIMNADPKRGMESAIVEAAQKSKAIWKDKDKNILEKYLGSVMEGAQAVSTGATKGVKDLTSLVGSYDKNLDKEVAKVQKKIDEPVNKKIEKLEREKYKYGKGMRTASDIVGTTANMAPGIIASAVTRNPNIGIATMGLSAKGQATEEALKQGADLDTAVKMGTTKGLVEAGTEKLSSGLKIFGKGPTGKWLNEGGTLDDLIEGTLDKKIKNKGMNFLAKQGFGLTGEIAEETISDLAGVMIDKGTLDPNANYTWDDFLNTAKLTFGSTLLTNLLTGGYGSGAYRQNTINMQNNQMKQAQLEEIGQKVESGEVNQGEVRELVKQVENGTYSQNNNLDTIAIQQREQLDKQLQQGLITDEQYNQELRDIANATKQTREQINNIQISLQESAARNNLDPESDTVKIVQNAMDKRGIKASFDANRFTDENANAFWSIDENGNREVVFNPNATTNDIVEEVAIHEITHDLMSSENSKNALKTEELLNYVKSMKDYESARKHLEETYSQVYDKNNPNYNKLIDEEVVADVLGRKLGNQEFINKLNGEKPNLAKKLYNWILDKIDNIGKSAEYKAEKRYWRDVADKFEKAFNMEYNNNEKANTKFTKFATRENNPYGHIKDFVNLSEETQADAHKVISPLAAELNSKGKQFGTTTDVNGNTYDFEVFGDSTYRVINVEKLKDSVKEVASERNPNKNSRYSMGNTRNNRDNSSIYNESDRNRSSSDENVEFSSKEQKQQKDNGYRLSNTEQEKNNKGLNNSSFSKDNQGRTLTKQQKDYFKDSKLRDKNGNLKVFYHGASQKINIFDKNRKAKRYTNFGTEYEADIKGFFFTENKDYAKTFGDVNEYYINSVKPLNMDNKDDLNKIFKPMLDEMLKNEDIYQWQYDKAVEDGTIYRRFIDENGVDWETIDEKAFNESIEIMRDLGYDSLEVNEGDGETSVFVFDSNQIKDIDNQNPTNNEDTRLSKSNDEWNRFLDENIKRSGKGRTLNDIRIKNNNVNTGPEILDKMPTEKKSTIKSLKKGIDTFRKEITDAFAPVYDMARKTRNMTLYHKADKILGSDGMAQVDLGRNQVDLKGKPFKNFTDENGNKVSMSWEKAYDSYSKIPNKAKNEFLVHQLNIDRLNQGVDQFDIPLQESQQRVEELRKQYKDIDKWSENTYQFYRNLIQNMVENGRIPQSLADKWLKETPHFIHIERQVPNKGNQGVSVKNGKVDSDNLIRKIKGGNYAILPIKESTANYVQNARRAFAFNDFGKEYARTIGTDARGENVSADTDIDEIFGFEPEFVNSDGSGNYTLKIYENGTPVEIPISEDVYNSLSPKTIPRVGVLAEATKIYKDLLTNKNPFFGFLRNPIKDAGDMFLYSKHSLYKSIKTYTKLFGGRTALRNRKITKDGVTAQDIVDFYHNTGNAVHSFYKNGQFKSNEGNAKKGVDKVLSPIEKGNDFMESMPRITEFWNTIESEGYTIKDGELVPQKGKTPKKTVEQVIAEASYNAADVTVNFKRGGRTSKAISQNGGIFFNPSVQGASKFTRNITEAVGDAKAGDFQAAKRLVLRAAGMGVAPAILSAIMYDDDDEYKEIQDYQKDQYYLIKAGNGKWIRIPKGRAISLFESATRRGMNKTNGEKFGAKDFGQLVLNQIAPSNPLDNNIFSPITSAITNKSWSGNKIVSNSMAKRPVEEQFNEKTDELSKKLGKQLGISPMKINYVINQYSGVLGDLVLPQITPKASTGSNNPIMNILRDNYSFDAANSSKNVGDFYDVKGKLNTKASGLNPSSKDKLESQYMNKQAQKMYALYDKKQKIQMDKNLSKKEKYQQALEVQKEINKFAKKATENIKKVDIKKNTATIGNDLYYKNENSNSGWSQENEKTTQKREALGLSPEKYYYYKNDESYKTSDGYTKSITSGKNAKQTIAMVEAFNFDPSDYLEYKSKLSKIRGDKGANGKTIRYSARKKKIAYLNTLPISSVEKAYLMKQSDRYYKSSDKSLKKAIKSSSMSEEDKKQIYSYLRLGR